jgi:hypothetical protein
VPSPAARSELVKKRHILLHPQREEVVFSTPRNWRYTSSMWGRAACQGVGSVMCRNIGLSDIEIYGSYLNRKEII